MSVQVTRRRNNGGYAGPDVVPFNNCFMSYQDAIYVCYGIIYSRFKNSDNQSGLACPKAISDCSTASAELTWANRRPVINSCLIMVHSVAGDRNDVSESYTDLPTSSSQTVQCSQFLAAQVLSDRLLFRKV